MDNVMRNLQNEWQKILSTKKTYVLFALSFLVPLAIAWGLARAQAGVGINAGNAAQFMMLMVSLFTSVLLPLFLGMAAIDLFTGEVQSRTMNWILLRPIARWKVYVSKVLALAVYLATHLGIAWLSSVFASVWLANDSLLTGAVEGLQAFGLSLFPLFAFVLLVVFIAQWFKSSSSALVFAILLYLAAVFVPIWFPKLAALSPTYYFDWYKRWMGSAVSDWKLMRSSLFLASFASLFFSLGLTMFEKRDY